MEFLKFVPFGIPVVYTFFGFVIFHILKKSGWKNRIFEKFLALNGLTFVLTVALHKLNVFPEVLKKFLFPLQFLFSEKNVYTDDLKKRLTFETSNSFVMAGIYTLLCFALLVFVLLLVFTVKFAFAQRKKRERKTNSDQEFENVFDKANSLQTDGEKPPVVEREQTVPGHKYPKVEKMVTSRYYQGESDIAFDREYEEYD